MVLHAVTPQSLVAVGANGSEIENNDFRVQLGANLSVVTQTGPGDEHVSILHPAPDLTVWHNLVLVFDTGMADVYLNGEHVAEALYTPAETLADELLIGSNACCGHTFFGLIDEISFYSWPMTADEAIETSEL